MSTGRRLLTSQPRLPSSDRRRQRARGKRSGSCFSPQRKLVAESTQNLAGFPTWSRHGNLRPIDSSARGIPTVVFQSDLNKTSFFSLAWRCRSGSSCCRTGRGRRGWPSTTSRSRIRRSTRSSTRWDAWIRAAFDPVLDFVLEFPDSVSCWPAGAPAGRQSGPQVHQFRRGNSGSWIFTNSSYGGNWAWLGGLWLVGGGRNASLGINGCSFPLMTLTTE